MRELKFRAWDKDKKEMFNVTELWIQKEFLIGSDSCRTSNVWTPATKTSSEIMQFTGLLDKNNKEIYEGDIICHFTLNEPRAVTFRNGAFGYVVSASSPYEEFISFAHNHYYEWKDGKSEHIEVIGNIYENPELFKAGVSP